MRYLLFFLLGGSAFGQWTASPTTSYAALNTWLDARVSFRVGASVPATCILGKEVYTDSGTNLPYWCSATNTFSRMMLYSDVFSNKTANYVLSGPTTGAAAPPTFRALVAADIPSIPDTGISYANKTANYVMAGPTTGAPATPAFRALVAADIPSLSYAPTANPTFTGTVTMPAPTFNNITGSTQCLHVNSSGVVSGTTSDCGGGGSMTWPSGAGIAVYAGSSAWGTSLTAPSGTIVGTTDTQALSGKTLTTPKAADIRDANGNAFIASTSTASAVDGLTVTNAATANPATVDIAATGSDTNINLSLTPKGTGQIIIGGSVGTATFTEGTAPGGTSGKDVLYADSTAHRFVMKNNNGSAVNVVASGADINTSDQVTVTHLASALPVNQGGTGTTSTLTGLMRGSGSAMTAAELSGDATTSTSNAVTVVKVNGTSVPTNAASDQVLGTTASATGAWISVSNCGDGTHALAYSTSSHAFSCQALTTGGASTTLNNLGTVALNADLKPGSWGSVNLGTSLLPFGTLTITSSTSGQGGYALIEAANADTAGRTFQLPAGSGTVPAMSSTSTTVTHIPHATAVAGIYTTGALVDADIPLKYRTDACEIHIWGSGTSQALQATDDEPWSCLNTSGADWTITGVVCIANAGTTTTVTPILTGGGATSILSGALTCGNNALAGSAANGSPVVHSATAAGTCSSTPCSIDANITAVDASTTNIRMVITYTY